MTSSGAPLVTIVVATRDRAALLPRAIASVLGQTVTDLELIVVDDGSTDGTPDLRDRVTDARVRWITQPPRGVSVARNTGLAAATGEWVAFLDDDDEYRPDFVERQLATARRARTQVVAGNAVRRDADGRETPWPAVPPVAALDAVTAGAYPMLATLLVRRSVLTAVGGFPPGLAAFEDRHLITRLALHPGWAVTPEPLLVTHRHGHRRLSRDAGAARLGAATLDRDLGPEIRRRAGARAYARWLRWTRGEAELQAALAAPAGRARAAAWAAMVALAPRLPWSGPAMARPVLLWTLGAGGFARVTEAYHHLRHAVLDRR